jgi:hypothetical protein
MEVLATAMAPLFRLLRTLWVVVVAAAEKWRIWTLVRTRTMMIRTRNPLG